MSVEIPRLTHAELSPPLRDALAAKVERLGYLGEFFAVGGHQPAALLAFNQFTEALKAALPAELTEVVALTVASEWGNDYERHQHERLARTLDFDDGWIAAATGTGDPANLGDTARLARELVLAMLADRGHRAAARVAATTEALGPELTVGLLLVVGRYVAHAVVSNSLELRPPVPSVFDEPALAVADRDRA